MKIKQYCSVCKEELDMEVVPTANGEEEGVLWLRCPRCQGFLPKISNSIELSEAAAEDTSGSATSRPEPTCPDDSADSTDVMTAAGAAADESIGIDSEASPSPVEPSASPTVEQEAISGYVAMLADADLTQALPYRPWDKYEIGDVIHHLAWEDCGVVVDKETLPGERQVVKVFFEKAGVVRLIEEDSRTM